MKMKFSDSNADYAAKVLLELQGEGLDPKDITPALKRHKIIEVDMPNYSVEDVFNLGLGIGCSIERERHTQPEKITFLNEHAERLQDAVKKTCRERHTTNDSISFSANEDGHTTDMIINPTNAHFLFNVAMNYGMLVERKNNNQK